MPRPVSVLMLLALFSPVMLTAATPRTHQPPAGPPVTSPAERALNPAPTTSRDPGRDAAAPDTPARETFTVHKVYFSPEIIPVIHVLVNFATVIQLPEGEEAIEVICGDTDWWQVASAKNLIYIKPSKEGARTNLDVTGKSGTLYMFVLAEMTPIEENTGRALARATAPADMKVIVEPGNSLQARINAGPKFITATEANAQA